MSPTGLLAALTVLLLVQPARAAPGEDSRAPLSDFLQRLAAAAEPLERSGYIAFLAEPETLDEVETASTLSSQLGSLVPYLTEDDLSLEKARHSPQPLVMGSTPGHFRGGLAVWRDGVFPIDHFARRQASALQQPWFEREPAGDFRHHATGAAAAILERSLQDLPAGTGRITLHRGTTAYESLLLELAHREGPIEDPDLAAVRAAMTRIVDHDRVVLESWETLQREGHVEAAEVEIKRQRYLASVERAGERERAMWDAVPGERRAVLLGSLSLLVEGSEFLGEFMTPDLERAQLFAKGRVVSFSVPVESLRKKLAAGELYVGLEKIGDAPAVEIGFLAGESGARDLATGLAEWFTRAAAAGDSQLFN